MNRSGQAVSTFIAGVGLTKILVPSALASFFALDASVALIALAISVLSFGVWYGPLRFLSGSRLSSFLGLNILAVAIVSISSPTLLGFRGTYLPVADIFLLLESGIVLQMIGLERKRPQTLAPLWGPRVFSQLFTRPFSHVTRSTTAVAPSR